MPLYEYECPACGRRVEKIARHDDPPPQCVHEPEDGYIMQRLISAPGVFELKGEGFYKPSR